MGFLDKLKSAVNAVTGNAAKVSLEFQPAAGLAGEPVQVKITATSTGQELKSGGVFIDLRAVEKIKIKGGSMVGVPSDVDATNVHFNQQFPVAPAFVLAPNETKVFEGSFTLPANLQPSYATNLVQNTWEIRGRIEATGNDPDSGFLPFRVGLKA